MVIASKYFKDLNISNNHNRFLILLDNFFSKFQLLFLITRVFTFNDYNLTKQKLTLMKFLGSNCNVVVRKEFLTS